MLVYERVIIISPTKIQQLTGVFAQEVHTQLSCCWRYSRDVPILFPHPHHIPIVSSFCHIIFSYMFIISALYLGNSQYLGSPSKIEYGYPQLRTAKNPFPKWIVQIPHYILILALLLCPNFIPSLSLLYPHHTIFIIFPFYAQLEVSQNGGNPKPQLSILKWSNLNGVTVQETPICIVSYG